MYDFSHFFKVPSQISVELVRGIITKKTIKSKKVAGRRLIASSASNFNILYGSYYQSNLRFKTVEKP